MNSRTIPGTPDPRETRRSARRRVLLGFGGILLLVALLATAVANTFSTATQRRNAEAWYVHTFDVLLTTSQLRTAIYAALRGERGYLLTNDQSFLAPYREGLRDAPALAARVRTQTRDNPGQQRNMDKVDRRLASYLGVLASTVELQSRGKSDAALAVVRNGIGRRHLEDVLSALDQTETEERRLLEARRLTNEAASARIDRNQHVLGGIAAVLMLLLARIGFGAERATERAERATEQLRRMATTDELTELANRRQFLAMLDKEVARAKRGGRPLSLAILDVDHFKAINDRHGHPAGDEVLRRIADAMCDTVRQGDLIGRIGGEEFAVLMPDTDAAQARVVAERLREVVEACRIRVNTDKLVSVTLSTGVALLVEGEVADHLVVRADGALYEAKANGRNQVRLAA